MGHGPFPQENTHARACRAWQTLPGNSPAPPAPSLSLSPEIPNCQAGTGAGTRSPGNALKAPLPWPPTPFPACCKLALPTPSLHPRMWSQWAFGVQVRFTDHRPGSGRPCPQPSLRDQPWGALGCALGAWEARPFIIRKCQTNQPQTHTWATAQPLTRRGVSSSENTKRPSTRQARGPASHSHLRFIYITEAADKGFLGILLQGRGSGPQGRVERTHWPPTSLSGLTVTRPHAIRKHNTPLADSGSQSVGPHTHLPG